LDLKLVALLHNSVNALLSRNQEGAIGRVDEVFVPALNRCALARKIGQQKCSTWPSG
jgi:hypothetical protein